MTSQSLSEAMTAMNGAAAMPRDNGELVFSAPWEGRAVALAVALVDGSDMPWEAFRTRLIAAIAAAPDRPYYESWAVALEALVTDLALATPEQITAATPSERPPQ